MKVTRIAHSHDLNPGKYNMLVEQARLLGNLRKEIWQRYGSIKGVGRSYYDIRKEWVASKVFPQLSAKVWKETLRDTLDDIKLYEAAAKKEVVKAIFIRTKDKDERKRLCKLLKGNDWVNDKYLCRKMRQHKKHGKTQVSNQIILEGTTLYSQFTGKDGKTWLRFPSLTKGKPVSIPTDVTTKFSGMLRLIVEDNKVAIHYTIDKECKKPCGDKVVGVDKGYTEAFADSEGELHGKELGKLLTSETEKRTRRGKARSKLREIYKKTSNSNIKKFNLGNKKLIANNNKKRSHVRDIAYRATHAIVDKSNVVVAEDLTKQFSSATYKGKKFNRLMSSWTKGYLAEALNSVTKLRRSQLRLVNCAYTSQVDSLTGLLQGKRDGDKFYHVNGEVSHAGINAATNIKLRADDTEIGLYTNYVTVKKILLNRLAASGGVSSKQARPVKSDRPSRTLVTRNKSININRERITSLVNES